MLLVTLAGCGEVLKANAETREALLALQKELGTRCQVRWHSDSRMSPDVFEVEARCARPEPFDEKSDVEKARAVLARSFRRKISKMSIVFDPTN